MLQQLHEIWARDIEHIRNLLGRQFPGDAQQIVVESMHVGYGFGNWGDIVLSWIYIEDAAAAIVAALERGRAGQGYNIVDDEPVRWHDFMTELARAVGAPAPWSIPRWALRLAAPYAEIFMAETSLRVSNARARSELGWVPNVPTYQEGVRRIGPGVRRCRAEGSPPQSHFLCSCSLSAACRRFGTTRLAPLFPAKNYGIISTERNLPITACECP